MIRFIPFIVVFLFVVYKIYKLNQKVLSAKAYIFIMKIDEGVELQKANYEANLFDFFKKEDAEKLYLEMAPILNEKYNNKRNKIIHRAETWGFVNTHTKEMFSMKKIISRRMDRLFLELNPKIFKENSKEVTRKIVLDHWDINALELSKLDDRVVILKLLLEEYKAAPKDSYKEIAKKLAEELREDIKYLDKEDMVVLEEWSNLISPRSNKILH